MQMSQLIKYYSKLPNIKGKNYLGNVLLDFFKEPIVADQEMIHGFQLHLNLSDRIQRQMFIKRIYESTTVENLLPFIRQSKVFFDVGANIGYYSLLAKAVNPQLRVCSFEPLPQNVHSFRTNLEKNKNYSIQLVEQCVSDSIGETEFIVPPDEECGWGRIAYRELFDGKKITRQKTTIDEFCKQQNIAEVDFIKIDVEGFEFHVLKGAEKLLSKKNAPHLCIEMNIPCFQDMGINVDDIFLFLKEYNYKFYYINSSGKLAPTAGPVENYKHLNYFAIKEAL